MNNIGVFFCKENAMDINKLFGNSVQSAAGVESGATNSAQVAAGADVMESLDFNDATDEQFDTVNFSSSATAEPERAAGVTLQDSSAQIQSTVTITSTQATAAAKKYEEMQEELEEQKAQYEALTQELQQKQAQYESLARQAENSDDEGLAAQATYLAEEISSMTSELTSLKSSIDNLETQLQSQKTIVQALGASVQNLANEQEEISAEAGVSTVNDAAGIDCADCVASVEGATSAAETQSTSGRTRVEVKSLPEYLADLDDKFEELYEKYGDDAVQYAENNRKELLDVDGDGRITVIDHYVMQQYLRGTSPSGSNNQKSQEERNLMHKVKVSIAKALKGGTSEQIADAQGVVYDLCDLENIAKVLGTSRDVGYGGLLPQYNNTTYSGNIDFGAIAQGENWEERLDNVSLLFSNSQVTKAVKNQVQKAEDYVAQNPENAQYATIAAAYQTAQKLTNVIPKSEGYAGNSAYWAQQSYRGVLDINGDGVSDILDYLNFPTDIDLDGDGVVSENEKSYLNKTKERLKNKIVGCDNGHGTMVANLYNNNYSIEQIIGLIDAGCDETLYKGLENTYKAYSEDYPARQEEDAKRTGKPAYYGHEPYVDQHSMSGAYYHGLYISAGYTDGTKVVSDSESDAFMEWGPSIDAVSNVLSKAKDFYNIDTIYSHWVSSADIDKSTLQNIINKINAASSTTQSKLTAVKQAAQARLAQMG